MNDKYFMSQAIRQAKLAYENDEVPVGAVIVSDGKIVATGYNKCEGNKNAVLHAEIEAISKASEVLGRWRLFNCTLYVTLEPCPMCAGAIINSRINKVVFGAYDEKSGALGSMINLCALGNSHKPSIVGGYMEKECKEPLEEFFRQKRADKK